MAAVAGLALLAGTAMGPTAFSVFIQPMGDDLGWSRTTWGWGVSRTGVALAESPLALYVFYRLGRMLDMGVILVASPRWPTGSSACGGGRWVWR